METNEISPNHHENTPSSVIVQSTEPFTELYPLESSDLINDEVFHAVDNELKTEFDYPLVYTDMHMLDELAYTPSTSTSTSPQFSFDPTTVAAYEHDYTLPLKSTTIINTPSPSPIVSKRTSTCVTRRISSRLKSRATMMNLTDLLNDDSCPSPAVSENSSVSSRRDRYTANIHRAIDVKTDDDRSYYLERRRKNNEASKMSRAARKKKFHHMDTRW
jgi:hypothetical protein